MKPNAKAKRLQIGGRTDMTEIENRELLMSLVKAADLDLIWQKYDDGDNRLEHFASLIISECANALVDHDLWNRHVAHAWRNHFGIIT